MKSIAVLLDTCQFASIGRLMWQGLVPLAAIDPARFERSIVHDPARTGIMDAYLRP